MELRERLAPLMKARRQALRLSVSAAAQAAQIARNTWDGAESGVRNLAEFNYAGVERALAWEPGSIDAIAAGGEPTPLPASSGLTPAEQAERDEAERLIMSDPALGAEAKSRLLRRYLAKRDRLWAEVQEDITYERQRDSG